jgi:hypothetical protein
MMKPLHILFTTAVIAAPAHLAGQNRGGPPPHPADGAPASLAELVACNDAAVGGTSLRAHEVVEYELRIVEPTFAVDGRYRATREGTARIDIYADGVRVFSEGWNQEGGWQQLQHADEPTPTTAEGTSALWHGLEFPGHLWTLADMEGRGHSVILENDGSMEGSAAADHETAWVRVALSDGHQAWFELERETCHIVSKRDFRAFHPDVDPERTWIETRFSDRREIDGVTRAWRSTNIDLNTGDTLGVTTVRAVRHR